MRVSFSVADCSTFGALMSIFLTAFRLFTFPTWFIGFCMWRIDTSTADNEAKGVFTREKGPQVMLMQTDCSCYLLMFIDLWWL